MQTYEIHSGDSLEAVLNKLGDLARTDPEITLVVPAHVQVLSQVDNLSRLRQFATDRGVRLHAVVTDPVTLGLFRIMGLDASDTVPGAAGAAGYPEDRERALAEEVENMNFDSAAYDRAVQQEGLGYPGDNRPGDTSLADAENMNFDIDELEQTLRAEGVNIDRHGSATAPPPPSSPPPVAEPAPERSRSLFGRLKQMINPVPSTSELPASEGPAWGATPRDSSGAAPPSGGETADPVVASPGGGDPSSPQENWSSPTPNTAGGLDVTMPDWLREEPPSYVPEHPPASTSGGNLDVSMPDWLREDAPAAPTPAQSAPPPAATTLPSWMQEGASPAMPETPALPTWMQPETPPSVAGSSPAQMPDWLRDTGTTPAPPASAMGTEPPIFNWLQTDDPLAAGGMAPTPPPPAAGAQAQIPDWLREDPPVTAPGPGPTMGLDAMTSMPDWLREDPPAATPGPGPTMGMDAATTPDWLREDSAVGTPGPTSAPSMDTTTAPPSWLQEDSPAVASGPGSTMGQDAPTTPEWLRENPPAVAPGPGPIMGQDAPTTPDWLRENPPAVAPGPGSTVGQDAMTSVPDWLREDPPAATSAAPLAGDTASMPDWLREEGGATPPAGGTGIRMEAVSTPPPFDWPGENVVPTPAGGAPGPGGVAEEVTSTPDWLREEDSALRVVPAVPPPAMSTEPAMPDRLPENATPPPAAAADPVAPTISPPADLPASVPSAPAAPAPATASPAGMDLSALGGPRQTTESVSSAVNAAAGIDARTRTLLLFGMALVRLAVPEARAAAEAARNTGLTTEDLRLVVEMAQALGGGPSERLGRRILEG